MLSLIPRYSLYFLLIFAPLARASVQPWAVTVIQIVTLIGLTALLLRAALDPAFRWIRTPLDRPFMALIALCLLAAALSLAPRISLQSVTLLLTYMAVFYLALQTTRTRDDLKRLVFVILAVATFLALFGLLKLFGDNPFSWWQYTDIPQGSHRLAATYGNPDHLAGHMEMALPLTLGMLLAGLSPRAHTALIYSALLLLAALILSLSRGGWVGATVALAFMGSLLAWDPRFKRKKLLAGLACAFLASILVLLSSTPAVERMRTLEQGQNVPSLSNRVTAWKAATKLIQEHPLSGTGPGTFAHAFTPYQPPGREDHFTMAHNDYVHAAVEVGLLLVPILLWMGSKLFRKAWHKLKNPSRLVRGTTLGALSGITALVVHSLGDFNLHIPANALLLAVLLAIGAWPITNNAQHASSHGRPVFP